ncbi:MAG TPA: RNA methyltransferase [Acidobacteriota bacterium]|nr:RNA methyltransferase [Acidobacteriota bacterium]
MENLREIFVVLVKPHTPGNIGAAARIVKNFGLGGLRLVGPCRPDAPEAGFLAAGAGDVLAAAGVYPDITKAVADANLVAGTTSSRGRRPKAELYTPKELAAEIVTTAARGRVCLVFGPERTGLTERELTLCTHLVSIPAHSDLPTLNLAQAVAVFAYEIFAAAKTTIPKAEEELPVALGELEPLFRGMQETLISVGFLSRSNPEHIMSTLRRILQRAKLTERDVRILRGVFSQIDWFRREGHRLPKERIEKP